VPVSAVRSAARIARLSVGRSPALPAGATDMLNSPQLDAISLVVLLADHRLSSVGLSGSCLTGGFVQQ
jgi:hypothetical protein